MIISPKMKSTENWVKKEPDLFDSSKSNDHNEVHYQALGNKDLKSEQKNFKVETFDNDEFAEPECQLVDIKKPLFTDFNISRLNIRSNQKLGNIDTTSIAADISSQSISNAEGACKMVMAADDSSVQLFHEEDKAGYNKISYPSSEICIPNNPKDQIRCAENWIKKEPDSFDCSIENDNHILVPSDIDHLVSGNKDLENDIAGRSINDDKCMDTGEKMNHLINDQECCKPLSGLGDLKTHMKTHASIGVKPFECHECGKAFRLNVNLNAHMRTHRGEKLFNCHECDKAFSVCTDLNTHMKIHAGGRLFNCYVCGKAFSGHGLNVHMRKHTGEKPFECHECGKTFSIQGNLKKHMSIHTGERPFECQKCDKSFRLRFNLDIHMKTHTGEKPFKCHDCGKAFGLRFNLDIHMKTHTGEKPFECSECGKFFSRDGDLSRHYRRIHKGEIPFDCHECGKAFSFSDRGGLRIHMRKHTGEKPFRCNKCDKTFSIGGNLKTHLRKHTGEKPFKDQECSQTSRLPVSDNLDAHVPLHTGAKPLECCESTKTFSRHHDPKIHDGGGRIHTEKEYLNCQECHKTFKELCVLNTHMKTHSPIRENEKLFSCHLCEKSFSGRWPFNRHMRTHTGEKPFECVECGCLHWQQCSQNSPENSFRRKTI